MGGGGWSARRELYWMNNGITFARCVTTQKFAVLVHFQGGNFISLRGMLFYAFHFKCNNSRAIFSVLLNIICWCFYSVRDLDVAYRASIFSIRTGNVGSFISTLYPREG